MTTPTPPPGATPGTPDDTTGGTREASRPPGFVPVPPRPRPTVPPTSRPAPTSRPDDNQEGRPPGRDGDVPSRPQIHAGRVDPRTATAVLGGLALLLVVTLWLAWAPTGLSAWLMGGVLLAVLAWAGTALWQRRGGRRPGLGRPGRSRLGGLLGGPGRPGRAGGLPGPGRARGRDGRFLGGLGGRLGGTAGRARDASRRAGSRLRGVLPLGLGGTRRPGGTAAASGRPGGRTTGLLGRITGRPSRGGTSGVGGHPSRGGTRTAAGAGGRPGGKSGTHPGGGTRGTGGSRGRGGSGGGTLGAIGRGLAGILPGRGRGGGTVIATDGGSLAAPDRTKPSRDRDKGRDDHDVDPDDTASDDTDEPDDDGPDRAGLPWWQRALYGLADRWQNADVRGWGEVLAEPLRRPVAPDFEVGLDSENLADPQLPPDAREYLEDPHTPVSDHEWPDDSAREYEWPADPTPPARPRADTSPHVSPHPFDLHVPHITTRSTTMSIDVEAEFGHHFRFTEETTVEQIRADFRRAASEAVAKREQMRREAADLAAEAVRADTLPLAREALMKQSAARTKDAGGYAALATDWEFQAVTFGTQKSA